MAGRLFLIADPHIGHKKAVIFREFKSQEDHDVSVMDSMIQPLNSRDVLIIAGDVAFCDMEYFDELLIKAIQKRWPGWKPTDGFPFTLKIVLGNHDKISHLIKSRFININQISMHLEYKIEAIYLGVNALGVYKRCVITHYPLNSYEIEDNGGRYFANLHGHLHSGLVKERGFINFSWEQNKKAVRIK